MPQETGRYRGESVLPPVSGIVALDRNAVSPAYPRPGGTPMVQGRVLLLGDAAFIPRPHTAASTAKAGANALALGRALREFPDEIDAALKEWETDQLALGRGLERSGRALGNRSQFP